MRRRCQSDNDGASVVIEDCAARVARRVVALVVDDDVRLGQLVHAPGERSHLGFGAGPHRCAGSHLAREEMRTAIDEFHARIPDYRAVDVAEIHMHGGGSMGMDRLVLRWDTNAAATGTEDNN